jgi:hypothetical protein
MLKITNEAVKLTNKPAIVLHDGTAYLFDKGVCVSSSACNAVTSYRAKGLENKIYSILPDVVYTDVFQLSKEGVLLQAENTTITSVDEWGNTHNGFASYSVELENKLLLKKLKATHYDFALLSNDSATTKDLRPDLPSEGV